MHVKTQNWKERFDKKFSSEWWNGFGTTDDINKGGIESIKSFITSLLEERDREWRERIENKKVLSIAKYGNMPAPHDETYKNGYNQALSDLLEEKK